MREHTGYMDTENQCFHISTVGISHDHHAPYGGYLNIRTISGPQVSTEGFLSKSPVGTCEQPLVPLVTTWVHVWACRGNSPWQ